MRPYLGFAAGAAFILAYVWGSAAIVVALAGHPEPAPPLMIALSISWLVGLYGGAAVAVIWVGRFVP